MDEEWFRRLVVALQRREEVDPDWVDHASCLPYDKDIFFPDKGASTRPAKRICETCPVRIECLVDGYREKSGVWGGLSEKERRLLRRRVKALGVVIPPRSPLAGHGHED